MNDPKTNYEFGDKELVYHGPLTIRFPKKNFDVLVLLCSDCLMILLKEGDKYCLKTINKSSLASHPVLQIKNVITRNNATDSRAFYLISKQQNFMYELVASTETEKNQWLKEINETALKSGGGTAMHVSEIKLRDLTAKPEEDDSSIKSPINKEVK